MIGNNGNEDRSLLIIIGGLVLGVGAGFFFFPVGVFGVTSVFAFTGCILGGFGLSLIVAAILSANKKG